MKLIVYVSGLKPLTLISLATASANDFSTWSCLYWYLPSPRALGQALSFSESFLAQSGHDDVSLISHVCKFAGFGGTSFKDCARNLI